MARPKKDVETSTEEAVDVVVDVVEKTDAPAEETQEALAEETQESLVIDEAPVAEVDAVESEAVEPEAVEPEPEVVEPEAEHPDFPSHQTLMMRLHGIQV